MSSPPPTAAPSDTTAATPGTGGLMSDILNADQLGRLRQLGVEYISQAADLTVAQLKEIGLSNAQIQQIQGQASALAATATTHVAAVASAVMPMLVSSLAPSGGGIPAMAVPNTVESPATVPLTSGLAAPPPMPPHDALPNNDMELNAVADYVSDFDDDEDDDDDDATGDENYA